MDRIQLPGWKSIFAVLALLLVVAAKAADWREGISLDLSREWVLGHEAEAEAIFAPSAYYDQDAIVGWLMPLPLQVRDTLWLPGHEFCALFILLYVPANESINDWSRLVTVQAFDDPDHSFSALKPAALSLRATMQSRCLNASWTILSDINDRLVYEWSVRGCPSIDDQTEVAVLVRGEATVFRVAYARKGIHTMTRREKREWIRLFKTLTPERFE